MQVCPTGIDIRKGLQYECIGCAACIDVCNGVMDRMEYPRGLIRYATQNGLAQHLDRSQLLKRVLRPRVLVYAAVLVLIGGALRHQPGAALAVPGRRRARPRRAGAAGRGRPDRERLPAAGDERHRAAAALPHRVPRACPACRPICGDTVVAVDAAEARWVPLAVRVSPEAAAAAGRGAHAIEFTVERIEDSAADAPRTVVERSTFVVPR